MPLRRALLLTVVLLLTSTATAAAATVEKAGTTITYTASDAAEQDRFSVDGGEPGDIVFTPEPDAAPVTSSTCTQAGVTIRCPAAGVTRVVIETKAGSDVIDMASLRVGGEVHGGGDGDTITAGLGPDVIDGGDDEDTVRYDARVVDLKVTLDNAADDGQAGEGDDVQSSVENVVSGSGSDELVGNGFGNDLRGGAGNDRITGAENVDNLDGGAGDDVIDAGDVQSDEIDCGTGTDSARIDSRDSVRNCESTTNIDPDNDSYVVGEDCDNANPNIHPNATDAPENGIDENCDGKDEGNFDRDADGFTRPDFDCDDADPAVNRGAREIKGNDVDENCDTIKEQFLLVPIKLQTSFSTEGSTTTIVKLRVVQVPAGGKLVVACSGRPCPFKKARTIKTRNGAADLRKTLRLRKLAAGATLVLTVTGPDAIGLRIAITFRRDKGTKSKTKCIQPNGTAFVACP